MKFVLSENDFSQVVVVIGSKPFARFPNVSPDRVYSANGAAERTSLYADNGTTSITAIAGSSAIMQDHDLKRVIASAPNRIIIRGDKLDAIKCLSNFASAADVYTISQLEQWQLQKKALGSNLIIGELNYDRNPIKKLYRFLKVLKNRSAIGLSTGGFAILIAALENPNAEILITGIGIDPGGHFYDHHGRVHGNRSRVDAWILPRLPYSIKKRLWTTDAKLANDINIKYHESSFIE